jgi:DNA-directed RNA polymerase subunit RPC12/RpoP
MILICDECDFAAQLEGCDFFMSENSALVMCSKCGGDEFTVRIAFKCMECGAKDFKPLDNSLDNCRHFQCPTCGSNKVGYF